MLEDEYYQIKKELDSLEFRIPQTGIKFKYGNFFVESLYDHTNQLVYCVKKDDSYANIFSNHLALYPSDSIGFSIRETNMSHTDIIRFINEIKKNKKLVRKISLTEGLIKDLFINTKYTCPICLDNCTDINDIYISDCGHAFHDTCREKMLQFSSICPICRK